MAQVALAAALIVAVAVGCANPPATLEIEVTREVEVTREIPATVQTVRTVEVTREVSTVREVPVTVEVVRTVEVPREVEVTRQVEVTREVPVTRPVAATPTPAPTPTPTPEHAPTPTTVPQRPRFAGWRMEEEVHSGVDVFAFRNVAVAHEPLPLPPVATILCDTRGRRLMYIDWGHPLIGSLATSIGPYETEPFEVYKQADAAYILEDYARDLHRFVDGLNLPRARHAEFTQLWRNIQQMFDLAQHSAPDNLFPRDPPQIGEEQAVNYGAVLVELDFAVEIPPTDTTDWRVNPGGATIRSTWRVLPNQRTLMGPAALGDLRPSYAAIAPPNSEREQLRTMTARVWEPEQPVTLFAKWEITDLDRVLDHCQQANR